ncbi:hypothetical protein [Methyloradius palustris]|uniref:Uncharacterized protein n=1 Tax=Methyloradius palustris TaxID=2778876 RepID=A0A8D5G1X8_9PROT|nr:hypothetical protein [Methyloradius palustris]BCM24180.1 hypothetical protein ZMTM_04390 [Methyloradius palustris]
MSKTQKILVALSAINLVIVFLFPPYDDHSVSSHGASIFAGFLFALSHKTLNLVVNDNLLYLEVTVVLVNLGVLWLLTLENERRNAKKKFSFRKAAMILVVVNLLGVFLFPPFEYISNMTNAVIPTFEGFYCIFSPPPYRAIVTPILYLEVMFILMNGGLMLLAFKQPKDETYSAEQTIAYMAKQQSARRR